MGILTRQSALEKALAEHAAAVSTVAKWETEQETKRAELADLEARIGDEVLADETAAVRLAEQTARLRSQIDVAARTATAAALRVVDAGRAVLWARAAELKAEANKLQAEVEARQAKTDRLLAELSEWEGGARYVAYSPSSAEITSAGAAGVSYKVPKTQALRGQANALHKQARDFEQHAQDRPETVAYWVTKLSSLNETSAPVPVAG